DRSCDWAGGDTRCPGDRRAMANPCWSRRRPPRRERRPAWADRRCAGERGSMTGVGIVFLTTFLASTVEAIEMVTIVVGVGATRGWRSTLIGAASGFGVLAVIVVVAGAALSRVPIGPLRLIVGALLLTFGLQW